MLTTQGESVAGWAEPEKVAAVEAGEIPVGNVLWWGFDPEDATAYLQAAIDSGAAELVIPYVGRDWVIRPVTMTRDNQKLIFEERVVVRARSGSIDNRETRLFQAIGRKNISLLGYGATLRMNRTEFYERELVRGGDLICLLGSENITIAGLTLIEGFNDGIYVGADRAGGWRPCRNITVRDVVSNANRRQGMSIVSVENMLVENCVFKNTLGQAPMAGIDCESHDAREWLNHIVIRNCLFLDNAQLGMHNWPSHQTASSKPVSILWEGNYVRGGEIGIHVASIGLETPPGEIIFRRNLIENTQHAGILFRRVAADSGMRICLEENKLINTAQKQPHAGEVEDYFRDHHRSGKPPGRWWRPLAPSAPIVLTAQQGDIPVQGNIHFDRNLIIHNLDEPVVIVGGSWSNGEKKEEDFFAQNSEKELSDGSFKAWRNVTGTIRVINPYGARMAIRTPVENFQLRVQSST